MNPYVNHQATHSEETKHYSPYSSNHLNSTSFGNHTPDLILEYLQPLGLTKYAHAFQRAEVDSVDVLIELTRDDLKEIGIPVGPRRKLLLEFDKTKNSRKRVSSSKDDTWTHQVSKTTDSLPVEKKKRATHSNKVITPKVTSSSSKESNKRLKRRKKRTSSF
eukprot:gb/GECH01000669.1/.p1 GENE.gb/GECH01000669.1/~~gb/GECH01000669.1/.p1  ORF type:complete len:162 (+),score=34.66 gb/GECH01000669.1/:1-486(+)